MAAIWHATVHLATSSDRDVAWPTCGEGRPIMHAHDEVVNHASKHLKLDLEGVEGMSHENERAAGRSACPVRIP